MISDQRFQQKIENELSIGLKVGIDCSALGSVTVYLKNGTKVEIDHDKTVEICNSAMESGKSMDQIIKEELYPEIKLMRLNF